MAGQRPTFYHCATQPTQALELIFSVDVLAIKHKLVRYLWSVLFALV